MHDEKQACKIATPEILISFQRLKGHMQMLEINIFGAVKILGLAVEEPTTPFAGKRTPLPCIFYIIILICLDLDLWKRCLRTEVAP